MVKGMRASEGIGGGENTRRDKGEAKPGRGAIGERRSGNETAVWA